MVYDMNAGASIVIGDQRENLAETIMFDVSKIIELFPNAAASDFEILVRRPGDNQSYTASEVEFTTVDDTPVVVWSPTRTDTYVAGTGKVQVRFHDTTTGTVILSDLFKYSVRASLEPAAQTPDIIVPLYTVSVTNDGTLVFTEATT